MELVRWTSVGLGDKDSKMLKAMIDEEIAKIPGLVRNLRLPEFASFFQIKDESEYAYGYTHGSIVGRFETYYFVAHSGKKPSGGEIDEIDRTIFKRSSEIRNAVFESIGR